MYPLADCQKIKIETCTNRVDYNNRSNDISMNANIRFYIIGAKNLVENVTYTIWMVIFPNGSSSHLACARNNTCQYVFPDFTINVTISSDHLDDSATINIGSADYNFTITHIFHTEGITSVPQMKVFNFHYIQSKNTEKVYYTVKPVLSGHGIIVGHLNNGCSNSSQRCH